jgi:hypothetical protein
LGTIKEFMRFYISTSDSKLDTGDSFLSTPLRNGPSTGFARVTRTEVGEEDRKDVDYVRDQEKYCLPRP